MKFIEDLSNLLFFLSSNFISIHFYYVYFAFLIRFIPFSLISNFQFSALEQISQVYRIVWIFCTCNIRYHIMYLANFSGNFVL